MNNYNYRQNVSELITEYLSSNEIAQGDIFPTIAFMQEIPVIRCFIDTEMNREYSNLEALKKILRWVENMFMQGSILRCSDCPESCRNDTGRGIYIHSNESILEISDEEPDVAVITFSDTDVNRWRLSDFVDLVSYLDLKLSNT